jgi:hypothetical protein
VLSDSLVKSATGLKTYRGVKYQTTVQRIPGLIAPGSNGINHGECGRAELSSAWFLIVEFIMIGIATDGVVALLTVTILK